MKHIFNILFLIFPLAIMAQNPIPVNFEIKSNERTNIPFNEKIISPPNTLLLLLSGSNVAPLGLKIGYKNKNIGAYLSYKQSLKRPQIFDYSITEQGLINKYPNNNTYYTVIEQKQLEGRAITGGLLFSKNIFNAYLGGGIGTERLLWAFEIYDFQDNKLRTEWAVNENFNRKGLIGELGFMVKFNKIVLEIGTSSIISNNQKLTNFDNFQINMGVGIAL